LEVSVLVAKYSKKHLERFFALSDGRHVRVAERTAFRNSLHSPRAQIKFQPWETVETVLPRTTENQQTPAQNHP
jgi:hypothetical protein